MSFPRDTHEKRARSVARDIQSKPRPNTRSNTTKTPSSKPKTKAENKQKTSAKREKQRSQNAENKKMAYHGLRNPSASPKNMTDEQLDERARLQAEQILESRKRRDNKDKVRHALTDKELEQREKCLDAKAQAILPTPREVRELFADEFEQKAMNKRVEVMGIFGTTSELTERDLDYMFYNGAESEISYLPHKQFFIQALENWIFEHNRELKLHRTYRYDPNRMNTKRVSLVLAEEMMSGRDKTRKMRARLAQDVSFSRWLSHVAQNPRYRFAREYDSVIAAVADYKTRTYRHPSGERHFILDIGPTNSGKTYSGMQELLAAESGVYLGPLRLLAMEAADTMNEAGTPCSLLTGEESNIVDDARHIASTVEMLNKDAHYDVAVIDECQMITDPERGYAWSAAIASIDADDIHLCLAPEAEDLICGILDNTDEDYEIVYHERLVPLQVDNVVKYPKGIRKGDAVIVFSRKQVQIRAAELEKRGYKTSMVYGALPYEVRKEEVRKFADGETDVVVATDAIGMGLNLPVQRVVFLEDEKYDGHCTRPLTAPEIRQIAGRAGRFGKYDIGYVSGIDRKIMESIKDALAGEVEQTTEIRLDIPSAITQLELPLCKIMRAWQMDRLDYPYMKRNLAPQIQLAKRIQDLPNDFVANAVEIPFKSGDFYVPLDDMWEQAVRQAYIGKKPEIVLYDVSDSDDLQRLEDAAKVADLAYGIAKRYGTPDDMERVDIERDKISRLMIERLKDDKTKKRCSWCGKPMDSTSSHNMHDACYNEFRAKKYGHSFDQFF